MGLLKRESAWTKEYRQVWRREQRFLERYETPAETALERKLDAKIPPALRETIHGAFVKAFEVVFKKGDTVIRKAGREEKVYTIFKFTWHIYSRLFHSGVRSFHGA